MKRKFLITGATGFVGAWVTRALIAQGQDVNILVRDKKLNWRLQDITSKLQIYQCDLLDLQLEKIVDQVKPTVVIHLAAYGALPSQKNDVEQLIDTNVKGLIRLINASKKHNLELFINTGSSSEYGVKDTPMKETDILQPVNDYGVTKSAATLFCQKIASNEHLPIITLRLFSPYGYYDDLNRLIPYVITKALKNESISLSAKENVRDFIYISDVVAAYLKTLDKTHAFGDVFNVGSGIEHSVYDIVDQIIKITKSKSKISWGTMPQQPRQVEPKIWQADIRKANKFLDWKPQYSLEEGLNETIEQFKKGKLYEKK